MVINYYVLNGKATIILVTAELIKKILLYKISYFLEPHIHSNNNNKKKEKKEVDSNLANYATKSDLKM